LVESGYEALTIERVASKAGVAKTTLYRRWSTKAQLVKHALDMRPHTTEAATDTGSLRGDLLLQLQLVTEAFSTPSGQVIIALVSGRGGDLELAQALGEQYAATGRAEMAEIIARAVNRGELASDTDRTSAIDLMISPIWYRALLWGESFGPQQLTALVDILVAGLTNNGAD
jgi:AcrR family transcriptional regulator